MLKGSEREHASEPLFCSIDMQNLFREGRENGRKKYEAFKDWKCDTCVVDFFVYLFASAGFSRIMELFLLVDAIFTRKGYGLGANFYFTRISLYPLVRKPVSPFILA